MVIDTRSKSFRAAVAGVALAVWGAAGVAENLRLRGELAATRYQLAQQRRHTTNWLLVAGKGEDISIQEAVKYGLATLADRDSDFDGVADDDTETEE